MKMRERLKTLDRKGMSQRIKDSQLRPEDQRVLLFMVRVIPALLQKLSKSSTFVNKLRKMIWGNKTESARDILNEIDEIEKDEDLQLDIDPDLGNQDGVPENLTSSTSGPSDPSPLPVPGNVTPISKARKYKKNRKNGLRGTAAYPDAETILCQHPSLKVGDVCPKCNKGKLYLLKNALGKFIQFIGQPFLKAKVFLQEKLRCNACLAIFSAPLPPEVGGSRGSASAAAVVAILKYGAGFPYFRMSTLQNMLKIPISPSGLWKILDDLIEIALVVWKQMRHVAAQGEILHNDDTTNKILSLIIASKTQAKVKKKGQRNGIFTTGILSKAGSLTIVLFFTGNQNARENLEALLEEREENLATPIQMSDASTTNPPRNKPTKQSCCLTHGRRGFIECYRSFKVACTYVILQLKKVYQAEALAKTKNLGPEDRLQLHQEKSAPIMAELKEWMDQQMSNKLVEENSQLGEAIQYMLNHWEKLTLFLRVAGAPLTNDELEQKFKMVKLHLKNAMFYKTQWGAQVGDMFMSLIHTCNLAGENPFEYFVQLQNNRQGVMTSPDDWMPWNYRKNLETSEALSQTA